MRSRPKIRVFLDPRAPTGGDRVRAEIELTSASETPVNGVEVRLVGDEVRHSGTTMAGNVPVAHYASHRHADLVAKLPAETLTKGVHRKVVTFDLPRDAPPKLRGGVATVSWILSVHVDIPWWPDRRASYDVDVRTAPLMDLAPTPRTFANSAGPRGKELYLEASVDRTTIALDDEVSGAVSVSNVRFHRIESIVVACVAMDVPIGASGVGARELVRLETVVHRGAPEEGAAIPFRFRFPANVPCTFAARVVAVQWKLEVRAVISFGRDVVMSIPVVVGRPPDRQERAAIRNRPVLPVGRDRRAILFAEAARRAHFDHEPGEERLVRALDGATVEVMVEHRGGEGRWLVAKIVVPDLGIDLHVDERRWIDALRGNDVQLERAFGDRFRVVVREPAQGEAYLDADVRAAVLSFREASLDDHGARLSNPGAGHTVEELHGFAATALLAARAIADAAQNIPPPEAMRPHVDAWRAFASAYGGRFVAGAPSVRDAIVDRERVDVQTLWDEHAPIATRVRIAAPSQTPEARQTHAAEIEALRASVRDVRVEADAIVCDVDGPIADPQSLVPTMEHAARIARALRGEREGGPYR